MISDLKAYWGNIWSDLCECDGLARYVDNEFVCICLQGSNESRWEAVCDWPSISCWSSDGSRCWGVDSSVLQTVDHLHTLNKFVLSAFHQTDQITTVHIFIWGKCYSGQSGVEFYHGECDRYEFVMFVVYDLIFY